MTSSPPSASPCIRIGSAPGSWGVWFPDDPRQVPWRRFPDEVSAAGHEWIELGPCGCLPTDPARLADETGSRGLSVSAGTVFTGLHHGPDVWDRTWAHVAGIAALTRAMGAGHLVVISSFRRDEKTGEVREDRVLTAEQWRHLTTRTEQPAREGDVRRGASATSAPAGGPDTSGARPAPGSDVRPVRAVVLGETGPPGPPPALTEERSPCPAPPCPRSPRPGPPVPRP